jgi:hypothetical protein
MIQLVVDDVDMEGFWNGFSTNKFDSNWFGTYFVLGIRDFSRKTDISLFIFQQKTRKHFPLTINLSGVTKDL